MTVVCLCVLFVGIVWVCYLFGSSVKETRMLAFVWVISAVSRIDSISSVITTVRDDERLFEHSAKRLTVDDVFVPCGVVVNSLWSIVGSQLKSCSVVIDDESSWTKACVSCFWLSVWCKRCVVYF